LDNIQSTWNLQLNKYQRDNLLLLLNACGYPGDGTPAVYLGANTGDWLGEIALMLAPGGKLPNDANPNTTLAHMRKEVSYRCNVPPEGWYCTRARDHEGPCAALPVND
jgi:hypothetical protein